jgi:hypothetical protein
MKYGILSACCMVAVLLGACGGPDDKGNYNKKVWLKPRDKQVKGYLSGMLEVADSSYLLDYQGNSSIGEGMITVRIRSVSTGNLDDYGLKDGNNGPLYLTLCDSSGAPVSGIEDFASEHQADALLKKLLAEKGAEARIPFHVYTYDGFRLPDDAVAFLISSRKAERKEDSVRADTLYYPLKRDWDQVIEDFERSVDEYASLVRKARRGDTVALRQYPAHLSTARSTEEVLVTARANNELTKGQTRRVIKIQDRLLEVIAEQYE